VGNNVANKPEGRVNPIVEFRALKPKEISSLMCHGTSVSRKIYRNECFYR
jgi:hypothetical protein